MFKQSSIFQYRLEDEVIDLRKQAEGMAYGGRRNELLRIASRIETSVKWLDSPGLRAPTFTTSAERRHQPVASRSRAWPLFLVFWKVPMGRAAGLSPWPNLILGVACFEFGQIRA